MIQRNIIVPLPVVTTHSVIIQRTTTSNPVSHRSTHMVCRHRNNNSHNIDSIIVRVETLQSTRMMSYVGEGKHRSIMVRTRRPSWLHQSIPLFLSLERTNLTSLDHLYRCGNFIVTIRYFLNRGEQSFSKCSLCGFR
jgi:hypothetical protein